MPVVDLRDVHLQLGRIPVLAGLDLQVEEGERLGVSGPNGAGKTTLLSVLATLRTPTAGHGTVLGAALDSEAVYSVRPQIGWSGHAPALYDELTLAENLTHFARLAGRDGREAESVLAQVGLSKAMHRRAVDCSNGMRRRADLGRLLMVRPRLLLLDEAHAGLDTDAAVIIQALAQRTAQQGGGVVLVSHDAEALRSHVDRVVSLREGRIVA